MTIETQIENQRLFAVAYASEANAALYTLLGINDSFTPTVNPPPEVNVVPTDVTLEAIPTYTPQEFNRPTVPTAGSLVEVNIPSLPDFPVDNVGEQPTFNSPDIPAPLAEFSGTIPTLADLPELEELDVASLLSGVVAPVPTAITIRGRPSVTIPEISVAHPGDAPTAPTDLAAQLQGAYAYAASIMPTTVTAQADELFARWFPRHQAGLLALETRLAAILAGDFDFDDSIADAITELARDQINAEYIRNAQDAADGPGKRGYTYPDMVYLAQDIANGSKRADANARGAMDLRKLRFDYQQAMLTMAIAQSNDLRLGAMQIYVNLFQGFALINGQCLDYGKAILGAVVEVFNGQVKAYEASLEGIKAEAAVAEIRLKAALAVLDVYRAELEAEKLKVSIDEQRVRLYEARLKTVEVFANVWKTKAEVITVRANIERLKFEIFDSEVKGFAALAGAKEAEYRGMAAQIAGEVALQDAWSSRVKARTVELEGYKAHVEALNERLRGLLGYNDGVTRQYESAIRAYAAENDAEKSIIETDISGYRAMTEGITKTNEARGQIADLKLKEWEVGKQIALKRGDQTIERAKMELSGHVENLKLQVEVARAMGANLQGIATAALNGINSVLSKSTTATS